MNIYLVVEGPIGEKRVYSHWVPLVNHALKIVDTLDEIRQNNVYIVSGGGYPNYFETIRNAVEDVKSNSHIDRLVIAVDSESMTYHEKRSEISSFVSGLNAGINFRIVVQHFCLETWALGNELIVKRNPDDPKLRLYLNTFNIVRSDPALLPDFPAEDLNRAQFAERYLRKLLNSKFRNLTYSKSNPSALLHDKYFERVKERHIRTGHISSFNDFLQAFV